MATEMKPASPLDYTRRAYPPEELKQQPSAASGEVETATVSEAVQELPKIAVFVAHGMGQQIPFQTMDAVASGLLKATGAPKGTEIRTRTVKLRSPSQDPSKNQNIQRIEMELADEKGKPVEVHVYEGYWAPLTEGVVTARDVVFFLINAASNGLRKWRTPFQRWLFGGLKEPQTVPSTTWHLFAVLLAFLSLVLLNAVIGAVALGRYFSLNPSATSHWPNETLLSAITMVVSWFTGSAVVYGLLLGITYLCKPKPPDRAAPAAKQAAEHSPPRQPSDVRDHKKPIKEKLEDWIDWNGILWQLFFVVFYLTIATGLATAGLILWEHFRPTGFHKMVKDWPLISSQWWPLVWVGLFGVSIIVRRFLIQYMGDVAAYITPHKLDRFFELRTKIRQWVLDVAQAVYFDRKESGEPTYKRIGIIGHSLGSVVVYDVLNRLLLDDELSGRALQVAERTTALVTFGSPLDKIAYLFGLQGHQTTATREALAASLQPLILDYPRFRSKLLWINVHSAHDIFSGELNFYDDTLAPGYKPGMKVQHAVDPDAVIPIIAHTEYWSGTTIYSALCQGLSLHSVTPLKLR
jgi:predicted alpha/beta hydrolase family esterase